jgi:hypothetical protein
MENKSLFPTEEVTLPSKGLIYPKDNPLAKGVLEMKYMTAKEEDILTNESYIKNGTVIDKLLQSLIVTPINYNDLVIGDKNAIMVAARVLGYGKDYTFEYGGKEQTVDLTEVKDKELKEEHLIESSKNEFEYILPILKKSITFKLLTHSDEKKILKELEGIKKIQNERPELTTRLKHMILSVDGDYERKTVREFVDTNLLARDARAIRSYIKEIQPDVDLVFDLENEAGDVKGVKIPIGITFFWPDSEL